MTTTLKTQHIGKVESALRLRLAQKQDDLKRLNTKVEALKTALEYFVRFTDGPKIYREIPEIETVRRYSISILEFIKPTSDVVSKDDALHHSKFKFNFASIKKEKP